MFLSRLTPVPIDLPVVFTLSVSASGIIHNHPSEHYQVFPNSRWQYLGTLGPPKDRYVICQTSQAPNY